MDDTVVRLATLYMNTDRVICMQYCVVGRQALPGSLVRLERCDLVLEVPGLSLGLTDVLIEFS
jgi:hypothetical protein